MSGRHYKLIVAGFNCHDYIRRCVASIAAQTYTNYDVCLVDDASTDDRQASLVKALAEQHGWKYLLRTENAGALRSQHEGITLLDPHDGDVIVWVDMDDALAGPDALATLDSYYDDDTPMTYGSYQPVPASETCPPAHRYPPECEQANDYRSMLKWGLRYNHLRTVRWELYKLLEPERDFFHRGQWMHLASDCAVMIPCLEMSGGKYKVIPEVLYLYSSDNPISEWRKAPTGTDDMHAALARAPRKEPVHLPREGGGRTATFEAESVDVSSALGEWLTRDQSAEQEPLDDAYRTWLRQGEPRDHNGSVDHEIKMYYLLRTIRQYGLSTFVESGTSHGDAVAALLPYVGEVHTIEAWREAFDFSAARFADESKVTIYFGDSGVLLPEVLANIGPAVFWLDAHYSGDGTAMLDKETPIVAELDAIAAAGNAQHAIVIDDARGFGVWNDYPTIEWMELYCKVNFPNHRFFLEGDEIFVVPA